MKGIKTTDSLASALKWVEEREKARPFAVATTAKPRGDSSRWLTLKTQALTEKRPLVFVFGTGHGLSEDVIKSLDAVLCPITGGGDYNHLSVRSAASIALDRFFGFR
jgi:tRNA (guanine37-N1)-methyltransferase